MTDEIKEILRNCEKVINEASGYNDTTDKILDCITNLQEELEDLRESDWAWHQMLKAQNKREYRSKFLKEFQQEYNTNTFPDYDEIYKRYDKLKKENKRLKENAIHNDKVVDKARWNEMLYKSRCEKAICYLASCDWNKKEFVDLYDILQGDDKDAKD